MSADDLSATLAGIRENNERVIALCGMAPAVVRQLAEHDLPRLVAALEAVLKLADKPSTGIPPIRIRAAITAELNGEEAGDAGT